MFHTVSFVALLVIAAADIARSFGPPQTDDHAVSARAMTSTGRRLTGADMAVIQKAVRSALAGRYAVKRVIAEAPKGQPPLSPEREDEYWLDERARIAFHRYASPDTARPGVMLGTILEFTDIPAVRCTDRSPFPGRRLGITYTEYRGAWHIGNPMVVDEEGQPWATGSPGYELLHASPDVLRDAGIHQTQGRRTRRLSFSNGPIETTVWIDVQSLLPIRETTGVTLDGRHVEVSTQWSYPPPRPITRPKGVTPPDCA